MQLKSGLIIESVLPLELTQEQKIAVQQWIDALRSKKYAQGNLFLHSKDGSFCVLGVACDVFKDTTGVGAWVEDSEDHVFDFEVPREGKEPVRKSSFPPFRVWEHFGINASSGVQARIEKAKHSRRFSLSELSDQYADFEELANILEIALKGPQHETK